MDPNIKTIYRSDLFNDQTALVTGGGSGIGLRCARELAALGAHVILAGRDQAKLEAARALIEDEGGQALAVPINIRDEQSVADCISSVLKSRPSIDLLLNNAGGQFPAPAESIKLKGWNAVIETNLTGSFLVAREVFVRSMKQHGGSILTILMNMRSGFPMMAHSGAARAGAENLTRTLANEWGRYGVRVNALAPGIIRTSGLDTYDEKFREFAIAAARNNQTTRLGTEAEIASGVLYLLSSGAAFVTGQTLYADGGESIYSPLMPPTENDRNPAFEP